MSPTPFKSYSNHEASLQILERQFAEANAAEIDRLRVSLAHMDRIMGEIQEMRDRAQERRRRERQERVNFVPFVLPRRTQPPSSGDDDWSMSSLEV
jgi:hypothetical protein